MLDSKKFEKTILGITIILTILSLFLACFPNMFSRIAKKTIDTEYPIKLFGKNVVNVEINADTAQWADMIDNKMSKPYIACNIKMDGQEFADVGLRPKGNSSLTSTQGERISFKLDFDHYIHNQNCYGLEQMVLNNLQADATYMKDYIAYDLMQHMGVDAPLHTFANITLNGEPFGVYLICEAYEEDYLERIYFDTSIRLYSVKNSGLDEFESAVVDTENGRVIKSEGIEKSSAGMGGPGGPPPGGMMPPPPNGMMPPPSNGTTPQMVPTNEIQPQTNGATQQIPSSQNNEQQNKMNNFPPPPGGMGGGGDLVYVDDSTSSYSMIFANAVFDDTSAKDNAKVIRAIKYLNDKNSTIEDLEKYWNVDEILRYFAVHTFMVNGDSYYGNMKQNYYILENDGKISIMPWDYNLSFGTFNGGGPGGPGGPNAENENMQKDNIDSTTEVINSPIDTPTIGVEMEDRPLLSVLLEKPIYMEKYHQYLNELAEYAKDDFINKIISVNSEISPYIMQEKVIFYDYEQHNNAFNVLEDFIKLRSQSIIEQIKGTIPSTTAKQSEEKNKLLTADFSVDEMGSMGGPGGPGGQGGPPVMENMQGRGANNVPQINRGNNVNEMMPPQPPAGMMPPAQQGGMMPPPPNGMMPPGMESTNNNSGIITIVISLIILVGVFAGAKFFKRNY